ncbi:hypothetical protein V6V47_09180 [Micromonospora sp. CPCC 205539]|uniref:hypothetical protein n=1 Tax=Micromonospora sp. CPCC 205539 TaxID=3122408 RepID=UPI002FEFDE67
MTNEKLRLSVGASPSQRVLSVVVGILFAAVGAAFVLLPLVAAGLLRRLTGPGDGFASYEEARDLPPGMLPSGLRDSGGGAVSPLVGLCGLPFAVLGVFLVLRVLRMAAWLDGSRVRVRGAFGSRTVDLATARIDVGMVPHRGTVKDHLRVRERGASTIVATDPDSGRRVTIPLRGMGLPTLPPSELRALADAITTGRPTGGRDIDAHAAASELRRLAEHPLGG